MTEALLIVNPAAGRGAYKDGLGEALHVLSQGGIRTLVHFTSAAGECEEIARTEGGKYELVCCAGGDGSLSDVISGLMSIDGKKPIVGYFPLGTTNDVARTLHIPRNDPVAAARIITEGVPKAWDVGSLGDNKFFSYVCAFGAFADVSYETKQVLKNNLGHMAYILEGVSRLSRLPRAQAHIVADDRELRGEFSFGAITNSTSVAGILRISPKKVELDDGKFEVHLVRSPSNILDYNRIAMELIAQSEAGNFIEVFQTSKLLIEFEDVAPLAIDGESGGDYKCLSIENLQAAIKIMVPKN